MKVVNFPFYSTEIASHSGIHQYPASVLKMTMGCFPLHMCLAEGLSHSIDLQSHMLSGYKPEKFWEVRVRHCCRMSDCNVDLP